MRPFDWMQVGLNICFVLMFAFQWGVNQAMAKSMAYVKHMLGVAAGAFAHLSLQRYTGMPLRPIDPKRDLDPDMATSIEDMCFNCGRKKHEGECCE